MLKLPFRSPLINFIKKKIVLIIEEKTTQPRFTYFQIAGKY